MIVVTGATGCLGRATVRELVTAGLNVGAVQRRKCARPEKSGCEVIEANLAEPLARAGLPPRCDAVVHLAQSRAYRDFPGAASEVFRINTAATMELAEYAVRSGASMFIYASSGSVYAPGPDPVPETARIEATSFYDATKIAAETLLRPFGSELTLVILRLFCLYGPGQSGKIMDEIVSRVRDGRPVDLHSRDGLVLTPTFTGDAARVVRRCITESWPGGVYNVAAPDIMSLREIASEIGAVLGRRPVFNVTDKPPPPPTVPDLTKLKAIMGRERFLPLPEGLRRTFADQ